MSLFDKLSSLANKAKESATTMAILAKDKRFERSLSNGLDSATMGAYKMATFGLPNAVSAMAFDPVASLLAIAGGAEPHDTYVRIFGKGLMTSLPLKSPSTIKYLQFKTGHPELIVIDRNNHITIYDLKQKKARHVIAAPAIVTCIEYCTGTDWLFLGYANGSVGVLNLKTGMFTDYMIADLNENAHSTNNVVVALQMHPTNLNLLLIGYEGGACLWNIKDRELKHRYILHTDSRLTCMAWSPCGNRITAGYDNGYLYFWDSRSDGRPMISQRISKKHTTKEEHIPDPIYQLAWYMMDNKSYLIVAGGSDLPGFYGLSVLEYDLKEELRETQKQTTLATSVEVSDFILLSRDPYFAGMENPLGVLVLGCDGSVVGHGLDDGFPLLTLPPAMDLLHPRVQDAVHVTQLEQKIFQMMTNPAEQKHQPARYLPLTGGVAGDDHVYKIPSNDMLVTIHTGNIIKFWDASLTFLKPLPHLTLYCNDRAPASVAYVAFDASEANLAVVYDSGVIILHAIPEIQASVNKARNEQREPELDDNIKELSEMLDRVQKLNANSPPVLPPRPTTVSSDSIIPEAGGLASENAAAPKSSTIIGPSKKSTALVDTEAISPDAKHTSAFVPFLKIALERPSTIQFTVVRKSIIAFSTTDGDVFAVNTRSNKLILAINVGSSVSSLTSEAKPETDDLPEEDANPTKEQSAEPINVTCLKLYPSYTPTKLSKPALQLYVGLSNGLVQHYDLTASEPFIAMRASKQTTPIVEIQFVSLQGGLPGEDEDETQASDVHKKEHAEKPSKKAETPAAPGDSHRSTALSDSLSVSSKQNTNDPVLLQPQSGAPQSTLAKWKSNPRWEYYRQANPRLLISVSKTSVCATLCGNNFRLFRASLNDVNVKDGDVFVHGQVVDTPAGSCFIAVLKSGLIFVYSLPTLTLMTTFSLAFNSQMERAFQSHDGRITVWTGRYELQQFTLLLQNNMPFGEAVFLSNPRLQLPPHPFAGTQEQKSKKSWILQNAFHKAPLTVSELNTILDANKSSDNQASSSAPAEQREASDNVFQELGNKMNERGERLNDLDNKFSELKDASGDFLKAVREYNERQAKKKWYEL